MKRETALELVVAEVQGIERWEKVDSLDQSMLRLAKYLGMAAHSVELRDPTNVRLKLTKLAATAVVTMEMIEYK